MEMLNAYSGSLKINQWAIGKKIGSIIRRQSLLYQTIYIEIGNRQKNSRYLSIMISIDESSSSSILSTETSLDNNCCCLQSGHNHFLLGLFFNFKQSKWNFPSVHCLLKHGNRIRSFTSAITNLFTNSIIRKFNMFLFRKEFCNNLWYQRHIKKMIAFGYNFWP